MALGLGEVLHPIAAAGEGIDLRARVGGDAPVGADHAVVAVFFPEQVADQVLAIGVAHVLAVFLVQPPADGVIGHNG